MKFDIKAVETQQDLDRAMAFERRMFPGSGHLESEAYSRESWRRRMAQNSGLMLIAEAEGEIAALVFGRLEADGNITVGPVAADPRFRGCGLARSLLLLLENRAALHGARTLALGAVQSAEGFYMKCGYKPLLLVQAGPPYTLEDLRALNKTGFEVSIHDGGADIRLMLAGEGIDRALQSAYDAAFPGCCTQTVFVKNVGSETAYDGIGNYGKHAAVWDWGGHDNTDEHEYWRKCAEAYGKNILIPMCALGESGAYMARRGCTVVAFDITPEMIEEGGKRYGHIAGLRLLQGDIRDFSFDAAPCDFCFIKDLGHLHQINDVKAAFAAINRHLRSGGGFMLETGLPPKKSALYSRDRFYPAAQVYEGMQVWKEGDMLIDAATARTYYFQEVHVEMKSGGANSFRHAFYLEQYRRNGALTRRCFTGPREGQMTKTSLTGRRLFTKFTEACPKTRFAF